MTKARRACLHAFTLIEVLVVVAIIALLISILLPSLSRAKEQTRAAVCLAHMHQMGLAFSAYSADGKGFFPWAAPRFRYPLLCTEARLGEGSKTNHWVPANIGGLYPRYVAKQAKLFYCPSCKDILENDKDRGIPKLELMTRDPDFGDKGNWPGEAPMGAYVYARPAGSGKFPRDAAAKMYVGIFDTDIEDRTNPGVQTYLNDSAVSNWLAPISKEGRMKMPMPAFVSDGYFGGFMGSHIGGYNVLYADLHGRRVNDPDGKIKKAGLSSGKGYVADGGMNGTTAKILQAWDYFSTRP